MAFNEVTVLNLSLSTVVLNSRDRHEKTWRPTFSRLTICFTRKKPLECIGNTTITLYLRKTL